jgi:phosphoglycolate phosphatase
MQSRIIVFDFDGTLGDTMSIGIDIYNTIAPRIRTKTVLLSDIDRLRGMQASQIFKEYEISFWKLPILLYLVKRRLRAVIHTVKPIPGVPQLLRTLHTSGYRLGIMTSNTKQTVEIFLRENNIEGYFEFIYSGRNIFGKEKVLNTMVREHTLKRENIIYIGDEVRDVIACKKAHISMFAVSWGLNSKSALESVHPNKVIDTTQGLLSAIEAHD